MLADAQPSCYGVNTPCHLPVLERIVAFMSYQSVNPYDGKILKTFKELTDQQLEKALKTAATCFETWRQKTFAERAVVRSEEHTSELQSLRHLVCRLLL